MRRRRELRTRIITRLPAALLDYPFETVMAIAAALSGLPRLLGVSRTGSVVAVLPEWAARAWGLALILAAATIVTGLARSEYGTTVAAGLRLLAWACAAYTVLIVTAVGFWATLPGSLMLAALAFLCGLRAFVLTSKRILLTRAMGAGDEA